MTIHALESPDREQACNSRGLEQRLNHLMQRMLHETLSDREYGELWAEFVELHAQRDPRTVSEMEAAKGLR